jgi:xanthine dehydrogenase accessory factor
MNNIIIPLLERLGRGERVVEALICGHGGSTPRTAGAAMLVFEDGSSHGSIGGGPVEAKVLSLAAGLFKRQSGAALLHSFDLSAATAAEAGMICGGHMQVCLQLLYPDAEVVSVYAQALSAQEAGRTALLCCDLGPVNTMEHALAVTSRQVLLAAPSGSGEGSAAGLPHQALEEARTGGARLLAWQGSRMLVVPHAGDSFLVLAGAGHVALHTAAVAARVGFRVVVLDDRPEFANPTRFPDAERVLELPDFSSCFKDVPLNANTYIVIATRGHMHDKAVLAQALHTPACYLGMLGSRSKREAVFAILREQGYSPRDLERVHCPVGLGIGAETPEEIAVSITAELIRERALRRSGARHVS